MDILTRLTVAKARTMTGLNVPDMRQNCANTIRYKNQAFADTDIKFPAINDSHSFQTRASCQFVLC